MRFSSVFQFPLPLPRGVHAGEVARIATDAALVPVVPAVAAAPAAAGPSRWPHDLPEDLDARVRLVGEWQLGED